MKGGRAAARFIRKKSPLWLIARVCDLIKLFTNPLTAGHMKTEALLRILLRRAIDLFEFGTEFLPCFLKRRALVQMAVRFRKPANR